MANAPGVSLAAFASNFSISYGLFITDGPCGYEYTVASHCTGLRSFDKGNGPLHLRSAL